MLWLNGAEIGWMAPYSRNLEEKAEFDLPLQAGLNEVTIFFDDLAERDARYFFQLDYLDGPRGKRRRAGAGRRQRSPRRSRRRSTACISTGRPISTATSRCFSPSPCRSMSMVNVAVEGDFMSTERFDFDFVLKAGEARLVIGPSENAPADFRHFRITLEAGGFVASRSLGVEICHADRQGAAPAALADRIAETLDEVSEFSERDTVRAFARLASGRGGADTDAMIEEILPSIEDCHDCADFSLVPLIWSRTVWGKDIGEATRARIDQAILGFRYWMDEPGNDVQWYFSENHALLFHTSAYLAGHLLADTTFVRSGRTGAEQSAVGAARVRAWLDHFEAWEMAEFNSAPYFPIDLKGLTALAALSPDADIAERAKKGIVRLCEVIARSAHHGMVTAAQGRSYEHTLCAGRSLELSGVARLLWGKGWYGRRVHALPQLAVCLRDHGLTVPESLVTVACHQADEHQEWRFAQGENRFAALYHYKSRDISPWGPPPITAGTNGATRRPCCICGSASGPEAAVWINHPGETIQFGYGRPSYWGGCGTLPRAHQYRGLAVLDFSTFEEQPDFTHAWFPVARIRREPRRGQPCAGPQRTRRGDAARQRRSCRGQGWPSANAELRQYGRKTRWIVRVCEACEPCRGGSAVSGRLRSRRSEDGSLVIDDPDYGTVRFRADGSVEAEGRTVSPKDFTVAGEVTMLAAN